MAQIVIPTDFASQVTLLSDIVAKNTALADKSPLVNWLKTKNIDLAADTTAATAAQTNDVQRISSEKASVMANQMRDLLFKPVYAFLLQAAQALKSWYKPNFAALLEWGIPITTSGRIDYKASFADRSAMCNDFFTKLASFAPGTGPLDVFISTNNIDVASLQQGLADAIKNSAAGITNAKLGESATAERNKLMAAPLEHIKLIGDFLKNIYINNVRTLGEWGFVVDDGDKKTFLRKSTLQLGETKTFTGIKLGSVLTNSGKVEIIVAKKGEVISDGMVMKPGDKMGMMKGYSASVISNTSTLEMAEFTLEMSS